MNADGFKPAAMTFLLAFMLTSAPMSFAGNSDETTAGDVGKKFDVTAQAIKNYSAEQRDEALKSARSVLADADARVDHLESEMHRNWDKVDASARKHAQETMRTLRRQRQDLSQSYGELKRRSANAWDEVKGGFARSYEALRDSFSRAAKKF